MLFGLSAALGTLAVAVAYATVLRADSPSYFDSPYWMGVRHRRATAALQLVALVGYIVWVARVRTTPPAVALNLVFLISSAAWPYLTREALARGDGDFRGWLWASCICIWITAAAALGMSITTAADDGVLLVPMVVLTAVVDGIMWTRAALSESWRAP